MSFARVSILSATLALASVAAFAQEAPSPTGAPMPATPAPIERPEEAQPAQQAAPEPPVGSPLGPTLVSHYDKAIFLKTIPPADLAPLLQSAGQTGGELWRDRQFRKLVNANTPGVMYHFGRDMPLNDAMDIAMSGSRVPVQVRENRYVLVGGATAMFGFHGRAFVWFDTEDGIMLGGFFFNPTNGEPSPTLSVFSKQTREPNLALSQLPPAFVQDLTTWTIAAGIPAIVNRYFIDDLKKRTLLEHDEDFCRAPDGSVAPPGDPCEQLNANAADTDLLDAQYLEAIHYATNGTAWMIDGAQQRAWLISLDNSCGSVLGCRIRLTRQRTHGIIRRRR